MSNVLKRARCPQELRPWLIAEGWKIMREEPDADTWVGLASAYGGTHALAEWCKWAKWCPTCKERPATHGVKCGECAARAIEVDRCKRQKLCYICFRDYGTDVPRVPGTTRCAEHATGGPPKLTLCSVPGCGAEAHRWGMCADHLFAYAEEAARERRCARPGCTAQHVRGSKFCAEHKPASTGPSVHATATFSANATADSLLDAIPHGVSHERVRRVWAAGRRVCLAVGRRLEEDFQIDHTIPSKLEGFPGAHCPENWNVRLGFLNNSKLARFADYNKAGRIAIEILDEGLFGVRHVVAYLLAHQRVLHTSVRLLENEFISLQAPSGVVYCPRPRS